MDEQLLRAVEIASTGVQSGVDASIVQQALTFVEQAKQNSHEIWYPAWTIFAARQKDANRPLHSHQQRLFGLSLVSDFLADKLTSIADPQQAVACLQDEALQHFDVEYVNGNGEDGASFVKNKFAQFLSNLLVQSYGLPPPFTLLPDLIARMRVHGPSSSSSSSSDLNPLATDMVLRLLHEVSITLGSDVTLRAVRSQERVARDTAVRDEIRATQAANIAESVWKVIEESFAKVQELKNRPSSVMTQSISAQAWTFQRAVEITCQGAEVIGDYVSWIDIGLVVTPQTVDMLYRLLQQEIPSIRTAAADALLEIVSKGMKSLDKLTLLRILNLTSVISELEIKTRKPPTQLESSDEEVTFREHLAKLANAIAFELARIVDDTEVDPSVRQDVDGLLLTHLDLVLAFLTDDYDELAEAVLPCIGNVLSMYKKLKRQSSQQQAQQQANGNRSTITVLTPEKAAFLSKLIGILLIKMKFDDETEWSGSHDEEEDDDADGEEIAHFLQLRKQLQQHIAAIAGIDESLFTSATTALIIEVLDATDAFLQNSGPPVPWQRAELALSVLFFYGEVLAGGQGQVKTGMNPASFVILPDGTPKSTRNKPPEGFLLTLTLNSLGEVTKRFFQSNISALRHPAVQMQYFDCAVRYSAFFSVQPHMLGDALAPFLDWRGIHNERSSVRSRTNYLFLRFLKETRDHIQPNFVQSILQNMQDVLVVQAVLPVVGPGEDPLEEALKRSTALDGQLDLYEACGVLLRLVRSSPEDQAALLKALIDPLSAQLRAAIQGRLANEGDLQLVLQIHHLFFALANLAKGFPEISLSNGSHKAPWMELFKGVIEQMLTTLDTANLSNFKIIRDAARGSFSRMVATTGYTVLPYVPALLHALLPRISESELLDFLSFLGLITAKYKSGVESVMDELLTPLLERTFYFLNQEVAGTDDVVAREQLVRGYITFLSTLIGAGLDEVLRSSRNQAQLETILQSLVFYASNGTPATLRTIANILARLVNLWLEQTAQGLPGSAAASINGATNPLNVQRAPLPGFDQFAYKTLAGLTFEIPAASTFDFDDAQTQIALTELCNLTRVIYYKRGQEFVEFLQSGYLPSINCPPELAQEVTLALQKQEVKEFRKTIEAFIKRLRGGGSS